MWMGPLMISTCMHAITKHRVFFTSSPTPHFCKVYSKRCNGQSPSNGPMQEVMSKIEFCILQFIFCTPCLTFTINLAYFCFCMQRSTLFSGLGYLGFTMVHDCKPGCIQQGFPLLCNFLCVFFNDKWMFWLHTTCSENLGTQSRFFLLQYVVCTA